MGKELLPELIPEDKFQKYWAESFKDRKPLKQFAKKIWKEAEKYTYVPAQIPDQTETINTFSMTDPKEKKKEISRKISMVSRCSLNFFTIRNCVGRFKLEDGTLFKIEFILKGIRRTSRYDMDDNPIYEYTMTSKQSVKCPRHLMIDKDSE